MQNYDTRVKLSNLSRYNVEAFVNLNPKVNGKPIELGGAYSEKEPWLLTAQQLIDGHFYITDVLSKADTDLAGMNKFYSPENVKNQLSMYIEVYYRGVTREVCPSNIWPHESRNPQYKDTPTKILVNPVQKWYFDFSRDVWIYDL